MFNFGFGELALITVIVVIVFGATKLPHLGDGLGNTMSRFRERQQRLPRPAERFRLLLRRNSSRRWTTSDWFLVCSAIAAGAAAVSALVFRSR